MSKQLTEAQAGNLRTAAEIAYSEMAFAVQELASNKPICRKARDIRAEKLAKAADRLSAALEASE